jgi:hypothetical protein
MTIFVFLLLLMSLPVLVILSFLSVIFIVALLDTLYQAIRAFIKWIISLISG